MCVLILHSPTAIFTVVIAPKIAVQVKLELTTIYAGHK